MKQRCVAAQRPERPAISEKLGPGNGEIPWWLRP